MRVDFLDSETEELIFIGSNPPMEGYSEVGASIGFWLERTYKCNSILCGNCEEYKNCRKDSRKINECIRIECAINE